MEPAISAIPVALRWGQHVLAEAGIDSPRLDAELLLADALRCRRAQLYTHPERPLRPEDETHYRALVSRRAQREPLAYILGRREFYGLDFAVDRRVLIPRPETELLVELAMSEAKRLLAERDYLAIADVGTGSGAITVALARMLPPAHFYAVDVSRSALEVAGQNCRRQGVEDRVHLLWGDLLTPLPCPVDLIVANLPYIAAADALALPDEIAGYEPRVAWDGGKDGLATIERLIEQSPGRLTGSASILMEIGAEQAGDLRRIVQRHLPAADLRIVRDSAGLDRVAVVDPNPDSDGPAQG